MADETRLHFDMTGDNQSLINSLRDAQKAMAGVINQMENGGKQVTSEMNEMAGSIENTFKRIAQAAGGVFAVSKAKELVSEIIDVRKEFQSLELSFATLTGDANKGKKLFADITQFATTTPMLEKDLAKGAQTLLGFNIEAEKIMPILQQIGDISMGDSQKFESLTLSFAQASSTGKLMGQDLLQMINAGFNPLVEISRTTGKSISELKDDMSAGKISVEMLQNAFKTATEEGGKFHGMLNGMANGLEGSFSNLEGAIQKLFNDLGQEIEGPIVEGANLATASLNGLAENLETVGRIIEGLVATYGTYKAACMAATAVEAAQALGVGALTTAEKAHYAWLLLTQKAQALLNATMLANPYVAAATAIAAVAAGLYVFANRATGAEQAQEGLNDAIAEQKQVEEDRNTAVQKAISLATDESKANSERAQGIQTLVAEYGPIIQKYIDEEGHLTNIIALKKEIALLDGKKTVSELQGQSNQYAEYAKLAERAQNENRQPSMGALESAKHNQNRKPLTKAERAALNKAMAQYADKTGGSSTDYSRAASYFSTMAKGTAKQAGTAATQANVNSFAEGIGAMDSKQLQTWQKRLKNAQTLAKSGSLVNIQGITKGATSDQINGLLTQVEGALNARNNKKNDDAKTKGGKGGKGGSVTDELQKEAEEREKLQEELTALERKNQEDENNTLEEGLSKKLAILKTAHEEEVEELQKQATDWAQENKKAKMGDITASASLGGSSYNGLTAAQAAALQNAQSLSAQNYGKNVSELYNEYDPSAEKKEKEAKLTRDIAALEKSISKLEAAGSSEAAENMKKRLEYAQATLKVSQTQSQIEYLKGSKNIYEQHEGNLMDLQNKRSQIDPNDTYALASNQQETDAENARFADELVKLQTGFEQAWQNFDILSTQALAELEAKLKDAVENGVNGQKVSAELAKELQNKLSEIKLQKQTTEWKETTTGKMFSEGGVFGKNGLVGNSFIGKFGQQQQEINQAQSRYDIAKQENDKAKQNVDEAEQKYGKDSQEYVDAKKDQNEKQEKEDSAGSSLQSMMTDAMTGGVGMMVNGINANVQSMAEAGNMLFGEDSDAAKTIGKFAESSQYATDAFNSLSQGDFIGAAMDIGQSIASMGEMFGFWSNSNYDDWKETNDALTTSNEVLTQAVDNLADKIGDSTASEAVKSYEAAVSALDTANANARSQMANNAQLYDGGGSINREFNDNGWARINAANMWEKLYEMTGNEKYKIGNGQYLNGDSNWEDLAPALGKVLQETDARDLEKLYADSYGKQLLTQFVQDIRNASGNDNYGSQGDLGSEVLDYINTYRQSAYDRLSDQLIEATTNLSFDSFRDNFTSMLMDLNNEVDEFGDNFREQLTQTIVSDTIKDKYSAELESLQNQWAGILKDRTSLQASGKWESELTRLQNWEASLSARMIAERDEIAAVTGYDDNESQKATRSSIENITQDQADQLIGRITAMQIAVEANNATTQTQAQNTLNSYNVLMSMNNTMSLANTNLSDILMQHVQSNSYLADIVKYQRGIYEEMDGRIEKMSNKLDTL